MKKNMQILYYLGMTIAGIGGLIYYIFVPNVFLLIGSIIYAISGCICARSTIVGNEFKFGMIGHISFIIFILFLASVYFIAFGTMTDFNPILYGALISLGAMAGIFIGVKRNKVANKD